MLGNTIERIYFHFRNEARLFPSPFVVVNGWFIILEKVFRNGYLNACSTALRSATEGMNLVAT